MRPCHACSRCPADTRPARAPKKKPACDCRAGFTVRCESALGSGGASSCVVVFRLLGHGPVDQFDIGHRRTVTSTVAALADAYIPARSVGIAHAQFREQFADYCLE